MIRFFSYWIWSYVVEGVIWVYLRLMPNQQNGRRWTP